MPITPIVPGEPCEPLGPSGPTGPVSPFGPGSPFGGQQQLPPRDILYELYPKLPEYPNLLAILYIKITLFYLT